MVLCYKCSSPLVENEKNCSSCGERVFNSWYESSPSWCDPIITEEYTIFDQELAFDETYSLYHKALRDFTELANAEKPLFKANCIKYSSTVDKLLRYIPSGTSSVMSKGVLLVQEYLNDNGIFGVTEEQLFPYIGKYGCYTAMLYEKIHAEADKIDEIYNIDVRYRQQRKTSRGKFVGGGFGISGAVKGMLTAGALNLTVGAIHSVGNSLGNTSSANNAEKARNTLLRKNDLYNRLAECMYLDVLNLHRVTVAFISDYTKKQHFNVTDEDIKRYGKICDDLNNSRIPHEQLENAMFTLLKIYPFDQDVYEAIVDTMVRYNYDKDDFEVIEEIGNYFSIDMGAVFEPYLMTEEEQEEYERKQEEEIEKGKKLVKRIMEEEKTRKQAEQEEKKTKYCFECGTPNEGHVNFCLECGEKFY